VTNVPRVSPGLGNKLIGSRQTQSPEDNTGGGRTNTSASRYNQNEYKEKSDHLDSQTVNIQRAHEHTRTGNWSESGFESLRGAPLDISRCLGGGSRRRTVGVWYVSPHPTWIFPVCMPPTHSVERQNQTHAATQHLRSLRSQKTMSGLPTQFASKTGVGTTGLFLCSNDTLGFGLTQIDPPPWQSRTAPRFTPCVCTCRYTYVHIYVAIYIDLSLHTSLTVSITSASASSACCCCLSDASFPQGEPTVYVHIAIHLYLSLHSLTVSTSSAAASSASCCCLSDAFFSTGWTQCLYTYSHTHRYVPGLTQCLCTYTYSHTHTSIVAHLLDCLYQLRLCI